MIKKWETISQSKIEKFKIFDAVWYKRQHPEIKKESDFIVLLSNPWVNIIPLTTEGNIILIEQYRHGIDNLTIEIPGGLVENNEDTRLAAERECIEETGYIGEGEAVLIGENHPNPAFLNNICYHYLWKNCKKQKEQNLDIHEDIRVFELPIDKIKTMIFNKQITHSLVLDAFLFYYIKNI